MSPGTFYSFAMIKLNMKETMIRPCILIYKWTNFLKKHVLNIKMTPVSNSTDFKLARFHTAVLLA